MIEEGGESSRFERELENVKRCSSYLSFYEIIKKSAECTEEREQERKRMGLEVGNRSRGDNVSRSILLQYVSARHAELTDWLISWEICVFGLGNGIFLSTSDRQFICFWFLDYFRGCFFVQTSGAFFFPVFVFESSSTSYLSSHIKIRKDLGVELFCYPFPPLQNK